MTISSSLNAGVSGLTANANQLSAISDNIANSATYGYKRAQTEFSAIVVHGSGGSYYTAGGVRTSSMRLIDERGPLIATSNPTDIAIDGQGFLPVTTSSAVNGGTGTYPVTLVTTGSFLPNADGVLTTESGQVLMGWPADDDGNIPPYPRDSMASLVPVTLSSNQYVANPTTQMSLGVNLPATSTEDGADGAPFTLSAEYYGNLGTSESLNYTFTPAVPAPGGTATNTWTMTITDSASGDAVVGEYTLTFDSSQASGGTLASVTTVSGAAYDPATGTIPLTVGGGNIDLDIGIPGQAGAMTQLSDTFAPVSVTKNGSPVATMTSVEIDENGMLHGVYDQGFTKVLYQIPVVDVPNPNGLVSLSGQSYQLSAESGPFYLWNAGEGPTGTTAGYAREESSVDVATELTQLITTQRAYSSNAKVIQTVDEMLQETTNLKR
jgi:flagellar hook protein FlgE